MRAAIGMDRFAARVAKAILDEAGQILNSPLLELSRETGRNVILPTARALFERVAHLGVAAALSGDNAFRRRGVREILNAARFQDWNPAHFLDTAEMATAVAIGLEWFGPAMSGAERGLVVEALAGKALIPALEQFAANTFWVSAKTNWNVVCCGGSIVAAIAIRPDRPDLAAAVLSRAVPAMASGLSAFDAEGGYPEGPGYWEYATKYVALSLAALHHAGIQTPSSPGLDHTWRYGRATTAPSGACFDYGDTLHRPGRSPVLGWLARRSGEAGAASWQRLAPGQPHPLDLVWLAQEAGATLDPSEPCAAFTEAGIVVLRGYEDGRYVGLKGGRNDVNHAHLDLGSFVLEWSGVRFVSELGRDDYALPGYFDPAIRFGYLRLGTDGHGTLSSPGRNQSLSAQADIFGIADRPGFTAAALEIDDPENPRKWRRGVAIAADAIWIVDEVSPVSQDTPTRWQAFTRAEVRLSGASATLSLDGRTVTARIVSPAGTIWAVAPTPSPPGEASNDEFLTLSFSPLFSKDEPRCVVVFSSGSDDGEPPGTVPAIAGWGLQAPKAAKPLDTTA